MTMFDLDELQEWDEGLEALEDAPEPQNEDPSE